MKEFIIRGQTDSGETHTINFSGHKGDYGFKLTEFQIFPSISLGDQTAELNATLTAAKVFEDPANPDFEHEGLIGTSMFYANAGNQRGFTKEIVNDTFLITQDLILAVIDVQTGDPMAVNWQCRFYPVKLSSSELALTNYRQFSIFDD